MQPLNEEQLNLVRKEVDRQDIHLRHLAIDLVDHICCEIEELIYQGLKFQEAFNIVMNTIGTDGLQQVQKDTLFLTDKKYRFMKNSMKITGVAGMILLAFGALLKIQHFPGANILTILGFFLMIVIFFPVSMMVMRKESKQLERPLTYLTALIGGLSIMFAILFKVMHWPGASYMFTLGYGLLGLVFLPLFATNLIKGTTDKGLKQIYRIGALSLFFCLAGGWSKFNHSPGALLFLFIGSLGFTSVFFPLYVFKEFKEFRKIEPRFIFLCVGLVYFNLFNLLLAVR